MNYDEDVVTVITSYLCYYCFLIQVSLLIRRQLTERANDFGLILDDVSITELSFSKYGELIIAKQFSSTGLRLKEC